MKLSIIVPVFNIKEYLTRCVSSILGQSFTDFELLLVDDGSTDGSAEMCDDFAKKDNRVKVIHQPNSGVSTARNNGISAASGEYIGFVDSDDWIDREMFSSLLSCAETSDADVVVCDCYTACGNDLELDTLPGIPQNLLMYKSDIAANQLMLLAGAAWRCVYKKEIVKNIIFPLDMKISEDRVFNISAMGNAKNIYYLPLPLYYRFVREGSAVNKYYPDYLSMVLLARNKTREALLKHWDESFLNTFEIQTVSQCYTALNMTFFKTNNRPLSRKLAEIKRICQNDEFLNAIKKTGACDIRARLVLGKHYIMLALLSKLANLKNNR